MKDLFAKAKYDFIREGHSYFGKMKQVTIFDTSLYAYVYVDQYNALKGYTEYVGRNPVEFEKLSNREKDWYKVKFGYFVLISNYRKTPAATSNLPQTACPFFRLWHHGGLRLYPLPP